MKKSRINIAHFLGAEPISRQPDRRSHLYVLAHVQRSSAPSDFSGDAKKDDRSAALEGPMSVAILAQVGKPTVERIPMISANVNPQGCGPRSAR